ncbi:MAG: hypothetical protein Q8P21_02385 [bacterium]|nr:hypothetical protein [bacterium]
MKTSIQPRYGILIILGILLVAYSLFEARFLILGPQVWVESPKDGHTVESPLVVVRGRAKNVAWISLNGRQIFTDEEGEWSEKLIVSRGLSIMTVEARDRFGRETEETLRVVLN